MTLKAPIVLFVYNRPLHTNAVLDALSANKEASESDLYVFCDGAKKNATKEDIQKIEQTRQLVLNENRFKTISVFQRDRNLGLANSIISGVSEILAQHETVIVMEDDIVPSKGFLKYMNASLQLYSEDDNVGCIHAWNYTMDLKGYSESTFFLKGADCWGWGTWHRAWQFFESDGAKLLSEIKNKKQEFDFDRKGTHNFTQMLQQQIEGKNDSWAVRWHASLFLENKYCLHPTTAVVKNIGLDNSGIHCGDIDLNQQTVDYVDLKKIVVEDSKWFHEAYKQLLKKETAIKKNMSGKIRRAIKIVVPNNFLKIISKLKAAKIEQNEWSGNYSSWEEVKKDATGYDSSIILEKCKAALLKVKNGEALYERDTILFDEIQLSTDLLNLLKQVAIENNSKMCVLDFGGSLGSSYFQNKAFLDSISNVNWCIVEQANFVKCGIENFEDERLQFFLTIEQCLEKYKPDIVLCSSVLQYIENPYELLRKIQKFKIKYLVFDRLALSNEPHDLLTVQKVPKSYYEAKLGHWFFSYNRFIKHVNEDYHLLLSKASFADIPFTLNNKTNCYFNLLIFQSK